MSQPLSGVTGQKLNIQNEKRKYIVNRQNNGESSISVRLAITLALILAGVVCVPVGVSMVAGAGAGVVAFGAVALVLGLILGVL